MTDVIENLLCRFEHENVLKQIKTLGSWNVMNIQHFKKTLAVIWYYYINYMDHILF